MFTGGEMIPYEAARDFEERTGALVLNFYGSNESGLATGTRVTDP
jgi:acyl-coenzyme A synthetase/AMP-(fatty) acid ligase